MLALLLKNPVLSAALALCVALAAALTVSRMQLASARSDAAEARTELANLRADIAEQRETFERLARATEARQATEMAAVAATYEQRMADARKTADRTIADLRTGAVRVQRRLQCPAVAVAVAGSAEAAAGGSIDHGPTPTGFTREDAEVALGIARDGDAAIEQLGACQSAIRVMQGAGQ